MNPGSKGILKLVCVEGWEEGFNSVHLSLGPTEAMTAFLCPGWSGFKIGFSGICFGN